MNDFVTITVTELEKSEKVEICMLNPMIAAGRSNQLLNDVANRAATFKRINDHVWFIVNKRLQFQKSFKRYIYIYIIVNVPVSKKQNKLLLNGQLTMYERWYNLHSDTWLPFELLEC